jgi:formylglycine-generating enzyme required for sulfatase activity
VYRANYHQDHPADGHRRTSPVGSFPEGRSPYGLYDAAGNVSEWVDETQGNLRLTVGGSWYSHPSQLDGQYWLDADVAMPNTGFRCAR